MTQSFDWINPYFFLRHQGPGGPIEFFCLGVHPDLGSILKRAISTQANAALILEDPYALYYCIFSYWNTMCLDVFWRLAEEIWEMEHGSLMLSTSPGEIYRQRHEIARHAIQLTDEVAPISYNIFCALADDHKTNPYSAKVDSSGYKQTKQGFEDLRSRFKSSIHRSRTLEKRLSNQIQLVRSSRLCSLRVYSCI